MQWQRILHGFGDSIKYAGRVHSVYEFSAAAFPSQMIRIKIVEAPEGQFQAVPDHVISQVHGDCSSFALADSVSAEAALQGALTCFMGQLAAAGPGARLERVQYW